MASGERQFAFLVHREGSCCPCKGPCPCHLLVSHAGSLDSAGSESDTERTIQVTSGKSDFSLGGVSCTSRGRLCTKCELHAETEHPRWGTFILGKSHHWGHVARDYRQAPEKPAPAAWLRPLPTAIPPCPPAPKGALGLGDPCWAVLPPPGTPRTASNSPCVCSQGLYCW